MPIPGFLCIFYQVIQLGGPTTFSDEGYFTKSEIDEKSQNFLDLLIFKKLIPPEKSPIFLFLPTSPLMMGSVTRSFPLSRQLLR